MNESFPPNRTSTRTLGTRLARAILALAGAWLSFSLVSHASGEALVLHGGQRLPGSEVVFANGQFVFADGETVDRDQVADWWLAGDAADAFTESETELDTDVAALAAGERLRRFRREGRRLAAEHPGVPAVLIVDDGEYTLTWDRRHVFRYHMVALVLDESKLDYARISLGFTEGRSRSRILSARCLTPDDRLLVLDPASAQISTPSGGDVNFNPNSRRLSATIPGVEIGAVVEAVYEFEEYAPADWRLFTPGYYFQGEQPVWRSHYIARVPLDTKLYTWEENWDLPGDGGGWFRGLRRLFRRSPRSSSVATWRDGRDYREYSWSRHDMPPVVGEPSMPPYWRLVPAVHGSLFKTWDYLNQLTGGMQRERIRATPRIQALAEELTADCATPEETVATLYHWVQKNIRYISIKSSLSSGWAGHPAPQTLEQGYGDCTDKATLFCSLLKAVGIEAEPLVLLTNDQGTFVPRYPVLHANHAIVEVHLPSGSIILDPTSQDYRFPHFRGDDHGAFAINFIRGTRRMTPVPPGLEAHGKKIAETMTVHPHGDFEVAAENHYTGDYEAALRGGWKRVPEHIRDQVMQQYLNSIAPGARLLDFQPGPADDLSSPFFLRYRYRLPDFVKMAGAYRLLQLPERELSFDELSAEKRLYPLVYRTSEATVRRVRVTLPETWKVVEPPPPVSIESPWLVYRERFSLDPEGRLLVETHFERPQREIPPQHYAAYRQAARKAEQASRRLVYFSVAAAGNN